MIVKTLVTLAREYRQIPRVNIDLMCSDAAAIEDPYYARIVRGHYKTSRRLHRRYWVMRQFEVGVAVHQLPPTFDEYFMAIEASARRNVKKAQREGCEIKRINFNDYLDDIAAIRRSAPIRQGRKVPDSYLSGNVTPVTDPPAKSAIHDYPYLGVLFEGKLIGYCSALVAGEYAGIEHLLGHVDHETRGVVPLLIVGLARYLYESHPQVRYYAYGTYFGASETMQRFKRKFNFYPHRVKWLLSANRERQVPVGTPTLNTQGGMHAS